MPLDSRFNLNDESYSSPSSVRISTKSEHPLYQFIGFKGKKQKTGTIFEPQRVNKDICRKAHQ